MEIWTRRSGADWQRTGSARVAANGTTRTFVRVSDGLAIRGRLNPTASHGGATGTGRSAAVDTSGRAVIRVSCPEIGALLPDSIGARAAGVKVGETLSIELCAPGTDWRIADVDPRGVAVRLRSVSGAVTDRFDLTLLRPGSRTVRLVQGSARAPVRSMLVMLDMAPLAIGVTRNVPLTPDLDCGAHGLCTVQADVFAPRTSGPWPVAVLLRGGPGGLGARSVYEPLAVRLASTGLVVFNADYRDTLAYGSRYPRAFDDAACAVRVARARAGTYGGSGGTVTLIGHSLGAYVGSVVALSANTFASGCLAHGSGAPDIFIGISGPYRLDAPNLQSDFSAVLGGSRAQVPYAWQQGDPFAWVGRRQGVRFRLIHGEADPTVEVQASNDLETALAGAGYDATLTTVAGGTHVSIIGDTKGGEWALAVILAAIR
jgi:fermentation-respiration switch protein FrsA (DUF1100 family)